MKECDYISDMSSWTPEMDFGEWSNQDEAGRPPPPTRQRHIHALSLEQILYSLSTLKPLCSSLNLVVAHISLRLAGGSCARRPRSRWLRTQAPITD